MLLFAHVLPLISFGKIPIIVWIIKRTFRSHFNFVFNCRVWPFFWKLFLVYNLYIYDCGTFIFSMAIYSNVSHTVDFFIHLFDWLFLQKVRLPHHINLIPIRWMKTFLIGEFIRNLNGLRATLLYLSFFIAISQSFSWYFLEVASFFMERFRWYDCI